MPGGKPHGRGLGQVADEANTTREYENRLIRADSVSCLGANDRGVVASTLDGENVHEIAYLQPGKRLPENFPLAFLAAPSTARLRARGADEDLVLVTEHSEDTRRWSTYAISDLWNG